MEDTEPTLVCNDCQAPIFPLPTLHRPLCISWKMQEEYIKIFNTTNKLTHYQQHLMDALDEDNG